MAGPPPGGNLRGNRGILNPIMQRLSLLLLALTLALPSNAQVARPAAAPKPQSRVEWLQSLLSDPEMKTLLEEQIKKQGGNPEAVFTGKAAADPKQDVKDAWHQSIIVTPRDPQVKIANKEVAQLLCYHVAMRSLEDCRAGNYLEILSGKEGPNYSAVALLDFPKSDKPEPWLIEARYDSSGDAGAKVQIALGHKPVPSAEHGDDSGRTAFVLLQGGKFFVELTRPPADDKVRLRRFYYFRIMKL